MKEKECESCEVLRTCFKDASIIDCKLAGRNGICVLPLETSDRLYGFLQISIENIEKFSLYESFLKNISNSIAINMENRWQKERMEASNKDLEEYRDYLENIVEKRTSELTKTNQQLNQVIAECKLKEVELQKYQDGLEELVEDRSVKLTQANQQLKCEILERKRAEEALERQKKELEIIFNSVPAMIFYKNKENRFIRVNNALALATGKPREKIEGKTAFEIYPDQADDYWKDDREVMSSGKPKRNIIEPFETDEGTGWVRTDKIPYRDINGNIIGIIGFSTDITEQKRSQEVLRESEEKYRSLFEHANDSIFIADPVTHRFLDVNENAAKRLGYTRNELLQLNINNINSSKARGNNKNIFQELKQNGSIIFEHVHIRKDGKEIPVEISSRITKFGGREVFQSFVRDITERKRAEEMLKTRQLEIEELNAHLEQ
jgi:PAS domain S-box-containing protein